MTEKISVLVSWSSGKDSAWMLHQLVQSGTHSVRGLFTTINSAFGRVPMHAVTDHMVRVQAAAIGLPLLEVPIPHPCSSERYGQIMEHFLKSAKAEGVAHIAFGDLYLEDVRRYREEKMAGTGVAPLFPLWGYPTDRLPRDLLDSGFRMRVTCVDPRVVPREMAGREYDADFLADLPEGVDPCGENGEFHTFVFDGPIFNRPLNVEVGRVLEREGFVFADVVEKTAAEFPLGHTGADILIQLKVAARQRGLIRKNQA